LVIVSLRIYMLDSNLKNNEDFIKGYLLGHQDEYCEITNWIATVVKNDYWGLKEDWDDIIQDVRMKLYINLKQKRFRSSSSLKTYVYRIAKYTCIDYLRKKYRTKEVSIDSVEVKEEKDAFATLIRKEQEQIVRQIFLELAERCRKILQMVFIEKLSYKEISSRLGVAEGTVKSRVSRCIEKAIRLGKKFSE